MTHCGDLKSMSATHRGSTPSSYLLHFSEDDRLPTGARGEHRMHLRKEISHGIGNPYIYSPSHLRSTGLSKRGSGGSAALAQRRPPLVCKARLPLTVPAM